MEKQQQPLATEQEQSNKEKIGFDGLAFNFLIFSVIILLPLASVIILIKYV